MADILCLPASSSSSSTRHFSQSTLLHGARKPVVWFHHLSSFRYKRHTHTCSHSFSFSSHGHCLVYRSASARNAAYNQAWHTSPLTLRQCVSSEPAVITTVDPLLTHDCLSTRTAARRLWWMELAIQKDATYSSSPLHHKFAQYKFRPLWHAMHTDGWCWWM